MEPINSPQDQERDQEIIERLKILGSYKVAYPPELFAHRRAAFLAQAEQKSKEGIKQGLAPRKQLLEHLEGFGSVQTPYPPELLTARRAAFIAQVDQLTQVKEEITPKDHELIQLLKKIKLFDLDYAPKAFAARRAAFLRQMAWASEISLLDALRSSIQNLFRIKLKIPALPGLNVMRTSLVIATLLVAAFIGSLLFRNPQPLLNPSPASQGQVGQPAQPQATNTAQLAAVICRPGFKPPLCLAREFDRSQDLTYSGNGSARPAVAKDTYPGNDGIHAASNANDGMYGPGASWTSDSAYSWIKIDLGKETTINAVTFGKDRLGNFTGGDPGQFVIAVALHDDVYADGVSTNDFVEYTQVFNSKDSGFNGIVTGSETIRALFAPVKARYVKITFQNAKTTVDEVEVYMARPADLTTAPTRKPKDNGLGNGPVVVLTAVPTNTLLPPDTPTPVPTDTVAPTNTFVPPTDTPLPTDTSTPKPTRTPVPTNTATPVPTDTTAPTDTAVPPPTDTPVPLPTDTAVPPPLPTDTPVPVIVPTDIATLVQGP